MSEKPKRLWRRVKSYFVVEAYVGRVWVQVGRSEVESALPGIMDKVLAQGATQVRVLEHDITHVCTVVDERDAAAKLKAPQKMRDTGRECSCPRCETQSPVYHDGTFDWIFCGSCAQAFPG